MSFKMNVSVLSFTSLLNNHFVSVSLQIILQIYKPCYLLIYIAHSICPMHKISLYGRIWLQWIKYRHALKLNVCLSSPKRWAGMRDWFGFLFYTFEYKIKTHVTYCTRSLHYIVRCTFVSYTYIQSQTKGVQRVKSWDKTLNVILVTRDYN